MMLPPKMDPKSSNILPKSIREASWSQDDSKEAPKMLQRLPRGPKRTPGGSKRLPRELQQAPKGSEEASRGSKKVSKVLHGQKF